VLGKAKVISFEDLEEARVKRVAKEDAVAKNAVVSVRTLRFERPQARKCLRVK
jgi:hypothetical protein